MFQYLFVTNDSNSAPLTKMKRDWLKLNETGLGVCYIKFTSVRMDFENPDSRGRFYYLQYLNSRLSAHSE